TGAPWPSTPPRRSTRSATAAGPSAPWPRTCWRCSDPPTDRRQRRDDMAHQWRGVITEYADRLPPHVLRTVITLREGGTPLIPAGHLSERVGAEVHLKYEGLNPTGSFKDRGMTTAISAAVDRGAEAVLCASTGNTS